MSHVNTDCRWGVICHSQTGASHLRNKLPNQDAIGHYIAPDGSPPVVLAVADGHGSPKSFRSDVGAQFAVETAVEVCRKFLDGMQGADFSAVKNAAKQGLPAEIVREWQRQVKEHVAGKPFTEDELARLAEQAGAAASERAARPEQHYVAYGTTILVAILTNEFLICFQLGDGDILAAYDATDEVGRVIARDEALIANETTSLCQDDAARQFRFEFRVIQHSLPGLVFLSTDGYANSFVSPDAFLKVGRDYLDMLRTEGAEEVKNNLPAWLEETSSNGSGDDITVGIIYRREPPLGKPAVVEQEPPESQGTLS
ncbi:MAG: PP2C family serine/threonine-protein phosphatase [Planctomycetota bacterium]